MLYHLSYGTTRFGAGQFVGIMCFHEGRDERCIWRMKDVFEEWAIDDRATRILQLSLRDD